MGTWTTFTGTFPTDPSRWFWGLANASWYKLIHSKYGVAYYAGTDDKVTDDDLAKIDYISETEKPPNF